MQGESLPSAAIAVHVLRGGSQAAADQEKAAAIFEFAAVSVRSLPAHQRTNLPQAGSAAPLHKSVYDLHL